MKRFISLLTFIIVSLCCYGQSDTLYFKTPNASPNDFVETNRPVYDSLIVLVNNYVHPKFEIYYNSYHQENAKKNAECVKRNLRIQYQFQVRPPVTQRDTILARAAYNTHIYDNEEEEMDNIPYDVITVIVSDN